MNASFARLALVVSTLAPAAAGAPIDLGGGIPGSRDLSAIETIGDALAVASDETAQISLLLPTVPGRWRVQEAPLYRATNGEEIDIEALALDGRTLYALGSHALVRPRLDGKRSRVDNRRRALRIRHDPARDQLLRLRLDPDELRVIGVDRLDLRPLLERDSLLAPFTAIPGKENGVDLEALAVRDGEIWIGLRSPILRSGLVPVLRLRFEPPHRPRLLLLDLDGHGVAALSALDDGGLLVLASAVHGPPAARLHWWDGGDMVPGREGPAGRRLDLGRLRVPADARAEGMTVLAADDRRWSVLIVYDGPKGGAPVRIDVDRPTSGRR